MAQSHSQWKNICCNPFNRPNHFVRKKNQLRLVTKWMCEKTPSILPGDKICDSCRKKLTTASPPKPSDSSASASESDGALSPPDEELQVDTGQSLMMVNQCLDTIGETPLTKRKLQYKKYSKQKVIKITTMMQKAVIGDVHSDQTNDEGEIIKQLKEKFSTVGRSEKIQILTVLPKSWSIRRVQKEFGVSDFMARKAKQLITEKGVLSTPNPIPGHSLPQKTVELVSGFYESDEASRMMPGMKDFVLVKTDEGRIHVQKRLVLSNLRELYQMFKDRYPNEAIGFSKFADLRPKHCVLAGASGTHSVCVCTIHQNVKLMMLGAKLSDLTATDGTNGCIVACALFQ